MTPENEKFIHPLLAWLIRKSRPVWTLAPEFQTAVLVEKYRPDPDISAPI